MATETHRTESIPRNPDSIFSTFDRRTIASAVEVLVAVLDTMDGDVDGESNGDELEADGTELDAAWIEWDKMRGSQKGGANIIGDHEDDEDSDPAEEDDGGGDVVTEDEPAFDPLSRAIANVMGADGPGGGQLLDSDRDDGEI